MSLSSKTCSHSPRVVPLGRTVPEPRIVINFSALDSHSAEWSSVERCYVPLGLRAPALILSTSRS